MRALAQPETLKAALTAGLMSSVACWPRIAAWPARAQPVWYLEAILFLGGTVLWAFVFAWHTRYTGRPVFTVRIEWGLFRMATLAGVGTAVLLTFFVDPALRQRTPEDYPADLSAWLAMTLFSLGFTQLFLVFAPFAWSMRLFRRPKAAVAMTVLFGVVVMLIQEHSSPAPVATSLLPGLLVVRVAVVLLSVFFFLKGGVGLLWWWSLLVQSRHLLTLGAA